MWRGAQEIEKGEQVGLFDGEIFKLESKGEKEGKRVEKRVEMGYMEQKESKRVSGMRDSLPGPEHIEGSRWKSGTVN